MVQLPPEFVGQSGPFVVYLAMAPEDVRVRLLASLRPVGVIEQLTTDKEGFVGQVQENDEFHLQIDDSDFRQFYPVLAGRLVEIEEGTAIVFQIVTDPLLKTIFFVGGPIAIVLTGIMVWLNICMVWTLVFGALFAFYLPIQFAVQRGRFRDVLEKFFALFQKDCFEFEKLGPDDLEPEELGEP